MKRLSLALLIFLSASVFAQTTKSPINFDYAFALPHRLTICLPNASNKTILDAYADSFQMQWTYQNCTDSPLGVFKTYGLPWKTVFTAMADSIKLKGVKWQREENYIPSFCYEWVGEDVSINARVVATEKGDVILFNAVNKGTVLRKISIDCCVKNLSVNTKWVDYRYPYNVITPISDRNDRIMIFDTERAQRIPSDRQHINIIFNLSPGAKCSHVLVRPYAANIDDLQQYVAVDWNAEAEKGLQIWRNLLNKAPTLILPDAKAYDAFKACLADMFVMREKQSDGKMAGLCGTDNYRAPNSFEPQFQAMALCKLGYFKEAKENIEFASQFQEPNGDWNDFRQWNRFMWGASGYKSYCTKQYYLLTHDKAFLQQQFPRMLASSRWSEKQRQRTKMENREDSPEWGLMPRGFGDCGLKNKNDLFGVFYPHNFIHCMGLAANAWAAKELGRTDVYDELYNDYNDLYLCLQKSLKVGAIHDADGTTWIPGSPNDTTGSLWGIADAVYPTRIIDKNSPLAIGTMKHLQKNISEGGLPENLGWMQGGLWVAIALDAISYTDIMQGNADRAASYYYATINHGTPLFSWCEERMPEKGTEKTSGDRQHAWTPICITRFTRDMLVMEDESDSSLWLTCAVPRWWYGVGKKIGISSMPTQYGKVSYTVERTLPGKLQFAISLADYDLSHPLKLQLRLPDKIKHNYVLSGVRGARVSIDKDCIVISPKSNAIYGKIILR